MIKFGIEDYETEEYNWAKHHKKLGMLVKRVREDGETNETSNEKLKRIMNKNPELLTTRNIELLNTKTDKISNATEYYLPIDSLEYVDSDKVSYYDVGAMNSEQTTYIRLKFMFEDAIAYIEHDFKSSGTYAPRVSDFIQSSDLVETVLDEIKEEQSEFIESMQNKGIYVNEEDDLINVMVVDTQNFIDTKIEVEQREFIEALVGIELYKFEQNIIEN